MRLRDLSPWVNTPPVLHRISLRWAVAVLATLLAIGLVILLRESLGWRDRSWTRVVLILLGLCPFLVISPLTFLAVRRLKQSYVSANGRLCPHCGYDVSNLGEQGTCPECGGPFDGRSDEPMWRRAGMAGDAAGAATSGDNLKGARSSRT